MCGIVGFVHRAASPPDAGRSSRDLVKAMAQLLAHRGPDDEGYFASDQAALGHRRLSIIDLTSRGRNPMPNEDGTIHLVFNGEIYNHAALRAGLECRGHRFRSDTDGEVILHLWEENKERCVEHLNGMFAFALWDEPERALFLARDRFGVKPLYYTETGGTLAFASEAKAFLALPSFRARPDPLGLVEHFTFQNTFGSRTLWEGVRLLPAGHWLLVRGNRVREGEYWDLRFAPEYGRPVNYWVDEVRGRFEVAVTSQLMSDVPVGSFLSGGMDTGAITAVASRTLPRMHTFTCGFSVPQEGTDLERYFDERDEARALAHRFGTVHHELELGPDAMQPIFPSVVWHLDDPRVGISYPVYSTAEMIRRHVTVVLSGVGGDELFGGYPWRYSRVADLAPDQFDRSYYQIWSRLLPEERCRRLFTESFRRKIGDFSPYESFGEALKTAPPAVSAAGGLDLNRAFYFDFKTFLNGLLLVDDHLSMAHAVESRVPFLDNHLVELAARIPPDLKLRDGHGKWILREAMRGLLPDDTLHRRKQGFTPPDRTWYKLRSLSYIRELLLGKRATDRGLFEPAELERIVEEHLTDQYDHRFLLWSLMCVEWWNRLFVDGDSPHREYVEPASSRHGSR
jgi:asparagine synthase (glutamine-hydrolysing)